VLDVVAAIAGESHGALVDAVRRRDGDAVRASLRALGVE
jgi:DNA-binding GntR family transcriptional regulator